MNEEIMVLVDENDQEIGQLEKIETHKRGLLHRAVSVFLVDIYGNWLLQQRAATKYHSPNLWTNAVCTHPRPGESPIEAAKRRLKEEIGAECELYELFTFIYKEQVGQDMIENEFDHIFLGINTSELKLNPNEVSNTMYIPFPALEADVAINPHKYTVWFKKLFSVVQPYIVDKVNIQY